MAQPTLGTSHGTGGSKLGKTGPSLGPITTSPERSRGLGDRANKYIHLEELQENKCGSQTTTNKADINPDKILKSLKGCCSLKIGKNEES